MNPYLRNRFSTAAERLGHSFITLTEEYKGEQIEELVDDPGDIEVMSFCDRTSEFSTTVKSLQSKEVLNGIRHKTASREVHRRNEFTTAAKLVGSDLASTCAKLEKLALLAKRKTLFDDNPLEVQELTYIIGEDINNLNRQIGQLRQLSERSTSSNNHVKSHSSTVLVSLQSRLASMSTNFKSVLDIRSENLKEQKSRREQFSKSNIDTSSLLPPSSSAGTSILLRDEERAVNMNENPGSLEIGPSGVHPRSRHTQQLELIEQTDSYIKERATIMESIESNVVQLGEVFQQLAEIVKTSEESLVMIDHNIDETYNHVTAGHSELLKYFQSISSNRMLMIKIFGIMIVFFILFIVFFA